MYFYSSCQVEFYRHLLRSGLITRTGSNSEDSEYLFRQLRSLRRSNGEQLQDVIDFEIRLEGLQECDDVQCENYYLKHHMVKKDLLEKHLKTIRSLKDLSLFSSMRV